MSYFENDDHRELRRRVGEFAASEVQPRIARMESTREPDFELSRLIAQQGWIGVTIGRRHHGMGLGHLAKTVVIEELARVSGAMGAMAQASQLGVAKIIHFGDDAMQKTWLPEVARGEVLPTIAVTEPESGGHVLGMTATAVRRGKHYVLNGRKVFVGNSHVGDVHGVVVRTGDQGSKSLSAFLVESDRPGMSLAPHGPAMGLHGFSFGELRFDNCRVPAENLVGGEGDGLAVAYSSSMLYGRANLTAVALGIHRALVEQTVAYADRRRLYGGPLHELTAVQQKIGAMQSRLMTCQLAAYHAVSLLDQGRSCDAELVNAKLVNVEHLLDTARQAMEIHAACGLQTEQSGMSLERLVRDAHHIYAPAGTSDIQRLRLCQMALGDNTRQWSDRLSDKVVMEKLEEAVAC